MLPINSNAGITILNNDGINSDDIYREIYIRSSIETIISLASSSKTQNARFYRLIQIDFLVNNYLNQENHCAFFPFLTCMKFFDQRDTKQILIKFPECRQERFRVLGKNGAIYASEVYGIDSYFDRKKIANGASFEVVKNDRTQKLVLIFSSIQSGDFSHAQQARLQKIVEIPAIQDFVIDDIITLQQASQLTDAQVALIGQMHSSKFAARYELTPDQVAFLVEKNCNPFNYEVIQLAHARGWLTTQQITQLNKYAVIQISCKRPNEFLYPKAMDKYPFLVIIKKYGLSNEQAFKLIQQICSEGNVLFYVKVLARSISKKLLTVDRALELRNVGLRLETLASQDLIRLQKLAERYNLSNDELLQVRLGI